ncbi:MAG: CDC27 family protein [Methanoregula sp.]|nr:CDC27 family protein [Methanoregula sp.]
MTDDPCPGLVDEDLLEQAIPLFAIKKIDQTTRKYFLKQIHGTVPNIRVAWAACESAIVPGLHNQDLMKAYLRIADRLNEVELFKSAALFYHKAVLTDPTDPTVWVHQGLFYFKQEKFIVALACFLNISSNVGTIYVVKTLNALGWHDQARACLNTLQPTKDEEGIFYLVKAECLYAQGDYQNALFELNKVIDDASSWDTWFTYAQICVKAGENDGLIRSLPHILPHWNLDMSGWLWSYQPFTKRDDLEWIDDLVGEEGIYCMNKEAANRFLLTLLVAHREKPERVTARINAFLVRAGADFDTLWQVIAKIPSDTWICVPKNERLHSNAYRHEMVRRMAVYLEKYEGDARGLWSGVTAGEVLRRLEEIGFGEAVTDYLMRLLIKYQEVRGEAGDVWDDDPHVNRVLARYILGQDALPAHPDVVYPIRKYFRHVDAGLHRTGTSLCKVKVRTCSCCELSKTCITFRIHGGEKRGIFWNLWRMDEEEDYPYSFYVGEEVCLAGTSVQGTVTRELQESLEACIHLADIEDLPEEVGVFYDLIRKPPLVKNQKC